MDELVGMSFKRNVYGPSLWTDIVKKVEVHWKWIFTQDITSRYRIPEIWIYGEIHSFPLSDVIFDFKELSKEQQENVKKVVGAVREKELLHKKIQEEWTNKQKSKEKL